MIHLLFKDKNILKDQNHDTQINGVLFKYLKPLIKH